jgi:hypothetical protein
MPFRKNVQRENILLSHWRQGRTVKTAGSLTGIPEGTISHYYARFNKNKEIYRKVVDNEYQEPPRSSPFEVAAAALALPNIVKNVTRFTERGDFAAARDYLQILLLLMDIDKRLTPIIQNVDPKKMDEVLKNMMMLVKVFDSI